MPDDTPRVSKKTLAYIMEIVDREFVLSEAQRDGLDVGIEEFSADLRDARKKIEQLQDHIRRMERVR